MKLLMQEDRARVLTYAPLQGETFAALRESLELEEGLDSMVFVRDARTDHGDGKWPGHWRRATRPMAAK